MFIHIAIFKWKPDTNQENITAVLKEVERLQVKIPGILEIITGKNKSKYSEGYTHVVLVRGENKRAIEEYRKHPDHKTIATKIEAMEEHGIGVDFEVGEKI